MKAVLMAGGEGTRLRPLTLNKPKPLMPVCNKPIMEHILERLREADITEIYVTLHYLASEIQTYFNDGKNFGVNLFYSIEESPLGTAGAVKLLEKYFTDTFLIMSGDALTDIDLVKAVKFHKKVGSIATIVLTRVESPLEYGVVIVDDAGKVIRFLEKPGWGEVFSDTVNTGIYILEPDVFNLMEEGGVYDFSRDLFPRLLADGAPIYGSVQDGYWCDIGNLKQYREVHQDALMGKIKLRFPGKKLKPDVWVGEACEISPTAEIHAPAIIGNNCKIKDNAQIADFSIVGDNCIIEDGAVLARTIVWNNSYIGKAVSAVGATVCRNNTVEEDSRLEDGVIVGDNCTIGKASIISPQVKIWPNKIIESGSSINMSIVWGQNWPGTLFSALGVKGIANIQVTPEYAARLGTAYGAYLPKGSTIITSRSPHKLARIIKRSMISGLMSMGINVLDLRVAPIPLTRHIVRVSHAKGGIHTRISPYEPEMLLIEFFDENGINISTDVERKIENLFFRQDYRRTEPEEVGQLEYYADPFKGYSEHFMRFINAEAIRKRRFKIVIDYSHGSLSAMLPPLLSRYGCEAVSVNAYMDSAVAPRPTALDASGLNQLAAIVKSLRADLGILVDGESEKISLVDSTGNSITGDRLFLLMIQLIAKKYKNPIIAAQVRAPLLVDKIVNESGGTVIRTKSNSRSLMTEVFANSKICFGGDPKGGFMFPEFQPVFDAVVSISKILELIALYDINIAELNKNIPPIFIQQESIPCTWDAKGKLMRTLVEKFKDEKIDLTDGVKLFFTPDSWVLIRPDPAEPVVHIIAEADTERDSKKLVREYKKIVSKIVK
ncbi:MAG: sugar phosphate nucleotidyltransferase [bacterium]